MRFRAMGGPAALAGPRFIRLQIAVSSLLVWTFALTSSAAALDWIPPTPVTAVLPSATLAPNSTHTIELFVLASGGAASLNWTATAAGSFPMTVSPASGSFSLAAGGSTIVSLSVTLPDTANGLSSLSVELTYQSGAGRAEKAGATILAASGGRPEIIPVPGTWQAVGGTSGSVGFQIHSLIGPSESIVLTTGRFNPDPNNQDALFSGSSVPTPVTLPGGGTLTVSAPTTLPANAYAGNLNAVQLSVTSSEGISTAVGHALVNPAQTGALPTALVPAGVTQIDNPAAGRDGPAFLAARGLWLVPAGLSGVGVIRSSATDSIGMIDRNGDGAEDRWIGNIHIPSYAAAIDVVPGFVSASNETLDVGLLAAGRAGLMLLDLRVVEDPDFGTWEDFFDVDGNGIDDRILRTIPLSGFATDVGWFRAPSGRVVALVADADTGSVPVSSDYNPAAVVPGTGQGIVAIDVAAALDTLSNPPFAAGTLPTPGSALDLELRGGTSPDLVVADGTGGLGVYGLAASGGVPATLTYTPRGTVALSSSWGAPYARDATWVSNTKDSIYVAVAAGAGGMQIVRVPQAGAGPPALVLAQQTAAASVGTGGTWTGTLAAALGANGVALLRSPGAAYLDRIAPAAAPPYTAPVTLAQGGAWGATGLALEVASHQTASSAATALRFRPTTGPIPNLLVSDGPRLLSLRPGLAAITAVEVAAGGDAPPVPRVAVIARPNPIESGTAVFEIRAVLRAGVTADGSAMAGGAGMRGRGTGDPRVGGAETAAAAEMRPAALRLEIYDARGRLVRRLPVPAGAAAAPVIRVLWDCRDESGQRVASGRYWIRVTGPGLAAVRRASPILIVR